MTSEPTLTNKPYRRPDHLPEVLDLERIDSDLFRANFVQLGGARALRRASGSTGIGRRRGNGPGGAHTALVKGYFLRRGSADHPTVFRVERDRDGRAFSARRVIAMQRGEVIFNMAASFHDNSAHAFDQRVSPPAVASPDDLAVRVMARYPALEVRADEGVGTRSAEPVLGARPRTSPCR
jgi:acyl-CoA thioesterase-2